jgi:hypothetical protein
MDPIQLEELVDDSASIIELEAKLNRVGHRFRSVPEYIKFLAKEWRHVQDAKAVEFDKTPLEKSTRLPTTSTEADGYLYDVHGICHGINRGKSTPGHNLSETVKKAYSDFHNSVILKKEDILFERSISSLLRIYFYLTKETHDHFKGDPDMAQSHGIAIPGRAIVEKTAASLMPVRFFISDLSYARKKDSAAYPKNHLELLDHLARESMSDMRYQNRLARYISCTTLPNPLQMEFGYLQHYLIGKNRIMHLWLGHTNLASPPERSLYMARQLERAKASNSLKKTHLICGASHTDEVIYSLENPGYSLGEVKEYYLSRMRKNG